MENKKIKILAIDDNFDNLITLQALILESFPTAEIILALNGKEGLALAASEDPDVILLDIVMPEMDGYEVCQKLKSDTKLSEIPVVFVTALKGDKESRINCLEAGAEAFLSKPIDQSELIAQIRVMIKIKAINSQRIGENVRLSTLVEERTKQLNSTHTATLNLLEDLKSENIARQKSEDALKASESLYRSLLDASPDTIAVTDITGKIQMVSPNGLKLIGYKTEAELIGKYLGEFLIPEDVERAIKNIEYMFDGIFNGPEEYRIIRGEGWVDVEINAEFVKDENGNPTRIVFAIRDITERKISQQALIDSEEKYRFMTEHTSDVLWHMDYNFCFDYVSPAIERMQGYKPEELIGKPMFSLLNEAGIRHIEEEVSKVRSKLEAGNLEPEMQFEYESICKDGSWIWVEVNVTIQLNEEMKPSGFHGITRNITERKKVEESLRESEIKYFNLYSLFRLMSDTMPDMMWAKDTEGRFTFTNKAFCDNLLGAVDIYEPIGKTDAFFMNRERKSHPENPDWHTFGECCANSDYETFTGQKTKQFDEFGTVKGKFIYLDVHKAPLFNSRNEIIGLVGTARDITARKQIENDLESSRLELQTIYDNAPVMMCVVDEKRRIQFANKAFTALTGFTEEMIIGGVLGGVIGCINSFDNVKGCGYGPKCGSCKLRIAMDQTHKTGIGVTNIEYNSTLKIGGKSAEIYLLGSTALIKSNKNENLLLCLHDITDRKHAEEGLQKSENLLRTFIDNSPFEIWARNNENVGILENKKLLDHYGSIIGQTPNSDQRVDLKTAEHWLKINNRVFAGEIIDEEYEFEIKGQMRSYQQIVFPIKEVGRIVGIAGFNIDITDKKIVEEKVRQSNVRLELAMQISNMAWWEMDILTGNVRFGIHKTEMIGFPPERFTHYKDFMELIHPDDYEKAMTSMRNHMYGNTDKYEMEYRILTSSGDYKWFYDIGSISKRDENGKPLTVSGLVVDVTYRKDAEKELADQKRFFEQMFMQSSLSTQILDKDGWCERVNPKLSEIFGVQPENIEGRVYNIFNDGEIIRKGIDHKLEKVFKEGKSLEWEVFFDIGKAANSQNININEKKKVWYSNWAYPILDQNHEISHVIIQHSDISDRKAAEKALSETQEQLKKFAAHLQNIREDERSLLARDIHDDLGQILIAMKIDLGLLKQNILKVIPKKDYNEYKVKFEELYMLMDSTLKSARRIMTDLRPEVLDLLGLVETINQHLISYQERNKINCTFVNNSTGLKLNTQESVALYRIVQESLNNISKHAKATKVNIILDHLDGKLMLEITDNGVGFDTKDKKHMDSYGLLGMKERVFLLDGKLTINSQKGKGTTVKVVMPQKHLLNDNLLEFDQN